MAAKAKKAADAATAAAARPARGRDVRGGEIRGGGVRGGASLPLAWTWEPPTGADVQMFFERIIRG